MPTSAGKDAPFHYPRLKSVSADGGKHWPPQGKVGEVETLALSRRGCLPAQCYRRGMVWRWPAWGIRRPGALDDTSEWGALRQNGGVRRAESGWMQQGATLGSTEGKGDPLAGLDDVDWSVLTHVGGAATDVPALLRSLRSGDAEAREATYEALYHAVLHQGAVYPSTITAKRSSPFIALPQHRSPFPFCIYNSRDDQHDSHPRRCPQLRAKCQSLGETTVNILAQNNHGN